MRSNETKPSSIDWTGVIFNFVFHIVLGCLMSAAKVSIFLYLLVHPGIPLAAILGLALGMLTVFGAGRSVFTFFLIIGSYLVCSAFFMESKKPKGIATFNITAWIGLFLGVIINMIVPIVGATLLKIVMSGIPSSS